MLLTDVGKLAHPTSNCAVAVQPLCKLVPIIHHTSWLLDWFVWSVCLQNWNTHLDCKWLVSLSYTQTPTHTHTSNRLTSPAKHSTPTSDHFDCSARLLPQELGSLRRHHLRCCPGSAEGWRWPSRRAVECLLAHQRGWWWLFVHSVDFYGGYGSEHVSWMKRWEFLQAARIISAPRSGQNFTLLKTIQKMSTMAKASI